MNNPMLEQLAHLQNPQSTPMQMGQMNLDQIRSMFNMVKNAGNKEYVLNQLMTQNPMLRQVADYANRNGLTYKAAFIKLAKEQGMDETTILKMLSG